MQQAKHEDLRSLCPFTDNDQLLRLVAFGYDLCGINTLDDFNAEDKGWKEVFAAKCRKMPQVVVKMVYLRKLCLYIFFPYIALTIHPAFSLIASRAYELLIHKTSI